jgi:1,4-dihydroxy-2-naphthoate octaprenyltransferase
VTGLLIGALLLDWVMVALFCASLVLGALYNLPPASLKDRAWGGTVANFLGHGMITFLVGWYAAKMGEKLDPEVLKAGLTGALSPGFANAAVYVTTTIADADGDKTTGKRTFCVVYGERKTAVFAAVCCFAAAVFALLLERNQWTMVVPALVSLFFFIILVASTSRTTAFRAFKWPVFLLSAIVAVFVPLYALLIFATFYGSRIYYRRRFGIEYPTFKAQ